MDNKVIQTQNSFLTKFNLKDIDNNDVYIKLIDNCIEDIKNKLDIKPEIKIYNKIVNQRRDVGFFSSKSIGYYYSGKLSKSKIMTNNLENLLNLINEMFNSKFNGILINRYNSGDDYISAHSDDEINLDKSGVVAISYGGERIFRIRDKYSKKIVQDIQLKDYDIIHMYGDFQKEFTHEIPST